MAWSSWVSAYLLTACTQLLASCWMFNWRRECCILFWFR